MNNPNRLPIAIVLAAALLAIAVIFKWGGQSRSPAITTDDQAAASANAVIVDGGHILPISEENKLLAEVVKASVLDPDKLSQVTELNLLWAFGLGNKNPVLTDGPMMDPRYGGPQNFASTGGWTAAKGASGAMGHYAAHPFLTLNDDEQALVEKVAKNTFRPCCKNSAYFPDCNHGMAMLGLLEILASQGAGEQELVSAAASANSLWFPQLRQSSSCSA